MSFSVRRAGPADGEVVVSLLPEVVAGGDAAGRYRWLYRDNPAGEALTWLAFDEATGRIAGLTSFFPWRLWVEGDEVVGALGGDGYVVPDFRRRGLGGLLHDASRVALGPGGLACMYGSPGAMNVTPLLRGGSRKVGDVVRWARPLSVPSVPGMLGEVGRLALRPIARGLELEPVRRHDPRVDELWRRTRGELRVAAVRDAAFYTWRYLESPRRDQVPHVVMAGHVPVAVVVIEKQGHHARLQDVLAPGEDWDRALAAAARHASQLGARLVDVKLAARDGAARQLWRYGFVRREAKPFLVMIGEGGDGRFLDDAAWFYTGGSDSDVEFM